MRPSNEQMTAVPRRDIGVPSRHNSAAGSQLIGQSFGGLENAMKPSDLPEEAVKAWQNPRRWLVGLVGVLILAVVTTVAQEKLKLFLGLGSPPRGSGVPPQAGLVLSKRVAVPGNRFWVGTGISVRKGDWLVFKAAGTWWSGISESGPQGDSGLWGLFRPACGACPVPAGNLGELVGQVGGDHPFRVGADHTELVSQDGELELAMNENTGSCQPRRPGSCYDDNRGEMNVEILLHRVE